MTLPYILRLVCLLAFVAGVMQAALQIGLAWGGRSILRLLQPASVRQRERALYLLQVGPALTALLFASAVFLPQYLLHEPDGGSERVSWITVGLACGVFLWFGSATLDALRITVHTMRFVRASRLAGRTTEVGHAGIPVISLPDAGHLMALAGFLRPVILVSDTLLEPGALDEDALRLALDHELSHALRRDNWKLLSLRCLPRPFLYPAAGAWFQQWQIAAECAADDEAAGAAPERRLLLAETLLKVARSAASPRAPMVYTALSCGSDGLPERIERLLRPSTGSGDSPRALVTSLTVPGIGLAALALAISPWIYGISEWILHFN